MVVLAELIAQADFLLVAAGAGWSADSGLPVYKDIADVAAYVQQDLEYQDLCDPSWLVDRDDAVFYGFWGSCLNEYRDVKTHDGYRILSKWKQHLTRKSNKQAAFQAAFQKLAQQGALPSGMRESDLTNDPFFIYTSNVDAHFHRHFNANEIYEIHGSVEILQCAGVSEGVQGTPCPLTWSLDPNVRCPVDLDTMRAEGCSLGHCPKCGGKVRPNVLMFHDTTWASNSDEEHAYASWELVMEQMMAEDPSLKLVVLEVGCGTRVPSVRLETEMVVSDTFQRCGSNNANRVSLIRINPDYPEYDHVVLNANHLVTSIRGTALESMTTIDRLLSAREEAPIEQSRLIFS